MLPSTSLDPREPREPGRLPGIPRAFWASWGFLGFPALFRFLFRDKLIPNQKNLKRTITIYWELPGTSWQSLGLLRSPWDVDFLGLSETFPEFLTL